MEADDDPRFTAGRTISGLGAMACLVVPAAALLAGAVAAVGFLFVQFVAGMSDDPNQDSDPCQGSQVRVIESAWRNDADEVSILLARGADPNRRSDGVTALSCALSANSHRPAGRAETVRALLDAGADPDDAGLGATPLLVSVDRGDDVTVDLLLGHGADPDVGGSGSPIDTVDPVEDVTPMMDGELLPPVMNVPPIIVAASEGDDLVAVRLLQADANPDLPAGDRLTALHAAAAHGHRAVVEVLLAADADPTPEVGPGVPTPAETAEAAGHPGIAKLLAQAGR